LYPTTRFCGGDARDDRDWQAERRDHRGYGRVESTVVIHDVGQFMRHHAFELAAGEERQ
jgi:hypothetical protein